MLKEERRAWKKGFKRVAGLDEVGRGSLSGPVVAAAIIIDPLVNLKKFKEVKDSKKLSVRKREYYYNLIIKDSFIEWKIIALSEKKIDKINILEATKKAMKKAGEELRADFLIIDGNFTLKRKLPQKSIIKADEKVLSCTLASILAKVFRDRLMEKYDKKYPLYNFKSNKGYPTKEHYQLIKKHNTCLIHRQSFTLYKKE